MKNVNRNREDEGHWGFRRIMSLGKSKIFVTGSACFVGLVDRLLDDGHVVAGYDNFTAGFERCLEKARFTLKFSMTCGDLLELPTLTKATAGSDFVFQLAANADVRFGFEHALKELEQNTIATFHVLDAMLVNGIRKIVFPSPWSIYGEADIFPDKKNAK